MNWEVQSQHSWGKWKKMKNYVLRRCSFPPWRCQKSGARVVRKALWKRWCELGFGLYLDSERYTFLEKGTIMGLEPITNHHGLNQATSSHKCTLYPRTSSSVGRKHMETWHLPLHQDTNFFKSGELRKKNSRWIFNTVRNWAVWWQMAISAAHG